MGVAIRVCEAPVLSEAVQPEPPAPVQLEPASVVTVPPPATLIFKAPGATAANLAVKLVLALIVNVQLADAALHPDALPLRVVQLLNVSLPPAVVVTVTVVPLATKALHVDPPAQEMLLG